MICIIDEKNTSCLHEFCSGGPFGCKISSLLSAYGTKASFIDFWLQYDINNNAVSAISKLGSSATVFLTHESDLSEICDFLKAIDVKSVSCNVELPFGSHFRGHILEHNGNMLECEKDVKFNPPLSDIYSVLLSSNNDKFKVPEFESFYVDISHRIRHNIARSAGLYLEKDMVSCAMTVTETADTAVIGAVATSPKYRKSGNGTAAVSALVNALISENKKVYILLNDDENLNFYRKMGFNICGIWNEYGLT